VRLARLGEERAAGRGDLGVGDARVGRARGLAHELRPLEAVEQAGDARRREQHALGQIDPAQAAVVGVGEVHEHLEVVDGEPVAAHQFAIEAPGGSGVRAQQADPGFELGGTLRGRCGFACCRGRAHVNYSRCSLKFLPAL
jgi:hypothetical protein